MTIEIMANFKFFFPEWFSSTGKLGFGIVVWNISMNYCAAPCHWFHWWQSIIGIQVDIYFESY